VTVRGVNGHFLEVLNLIFCWFRDVFQNFYVIYCDVAVDLAPGPVDGRGPG